MNLEDAFPLNAVLAMENQEPWIAAGPSAPLEYWKELCHEGQFVKDNGATHLEFKITRDLMDHWNKTFLEMSTDGMSVPLPVEHTKDPEKRRGSLVETKRQLNKRGQQALYGRIKFNDESAASLAKSGAGVSIFVPKQVTNGHGKKYVMPIEHVAITDYPVLHDLEPFQAVALSLASDGDQDVTLRDLATQAGIDPSITDEQQLLLALSQKLAAVAQPPRPPAGPAGPPRPPMPARPFGASKGDEPVPLTGSLLKMVREARSMKLDRLSTGAEPRITPAVRKKLEEQYLKDEVIALSHVDGFDDGFDAVVDSLMQNPPISRGGKTGPQASLALDKGDAPSDGLVKNMEKRAKQTDASHI
jgi:hypothetical protein